MPLTTIYLAGPIDGHTSTEAGGWRAEAAQCLAALESNLRVLNPLDKTPRLAGLDRPITGSEGYDPLWIFFQDVERGVAVSDVLLVGYAGGFVGSLGTSFEMGVAYALGVPTVLWVAAGTVPEHPFLSAVSGIYEAERGDTLRDACRAALRAAQAQPSTFEAATGKACRSLRLELAEIQRRGGLPSLWAEGGRVKNGT